MKLQLLIGIIVLSLEFANAQQLYVGANYHPHDDKNAEKIKRDIELMKEAGFTVVRMGHLAWDSYEPAEGKFDFAWFDQVMDGMNKAGIKVILDLAIRPAPLWLHHKYPSMNITDANGNVLYRNMDARVLEISKSTLDYKLLFVPGVAVMDKATADKVREFVKNGGTVVMTGNSAIVDETGQVFASTHPGIYVGLPANGEILNPLLDDLISELSLRKGPAVPSGVMARQVDKDHFLYLNVSGEPKEIQQQKRTHSVLFNKDYTGNFMPAPYEPEFIEIGN